MIDCLFPPTPDPPLPQFPNVVDYVPPFNEMLATHHTVVRYYRWGMVCRTATGRTSLDGEIEVLSELAGHCSAAG